VLLWPPDSTRRQELRPFQNLSAKPPIRAPPRKGLCKLPKLGGVATIIFQFIGFSPRLRRSARRIILGLMPPQDQLHRGNRRAFWQSTILGGLKIFLAGAVLGLVYNFSSPMGIRPNAVSSPARAQVEDPMRGGSPGSHSRMSMEQRPYQPEVVERMLLPQPETEVSGGPLSTRWTEVKSLVESGKVVLVDVRSRSKYEAGHIPGAISVPYSRPGQNFGPLQSGESSAFLGREFSAFRQHYPVDTAIVLYCDSASCSLSKEVATKLIEEYGYADVRYIPGGYQEWQQFQAGAQ
jgi:rhodanese-related sulfurtransferase